MNNPALTFESDDKLGLKEFSKDLKAFIMTERLFVEGSLVLSLNAPFGSGKSTFLTMWRNDLVKRRETDSTLPIPITWNSGKYKRSDLVLTRVQPERLLLRMVERQAFDS